MRLHRHDARAFRPRFLILLMIGLFAGVLGGLQIAGLIDRAGVDGMFGGRPAPPVEYLSEKPTEEDRSMGVALAAASARSVEDCRAFAPRHQAGCRAYFLQRRGPEAVFDSAQPASFQQAEPPSTD